MPHQWKKALASNVAALISPENAANAASSVANAAMRGTWNVSANKLENTMIIINHERAVKTPLTADFLIFNSPTAQSLRTKTRM
jgi:hypothetical protein